MPAAYWKACPMAAPGTVRRFIRSRRSAHCCERPKPPTWPWPIAATPAFTPAHRPCAVRLRRRACPTWSARDFPACSCWPPLGRPWQDWKLVSAHGCACTPALVCSADTPTFFLTGGSETPATLCEKLTQSSCENVQATVGENLGTAAQRLVHGTAQELARQEFAALSVLLVEPCPALQRRVPGLPDEAFIRGKTPMTKQEVRAAVLAKLAVRPGDILWDVGAGTGSISVEMALAAPAGQVYAAECDADACELIRRNRAKFHAENLHLTAGKAPEVLVNWPAPDAVFIGGSKGNLAAIMDAALAANPAVRLCISAIALETLQQAIAALAAHGLSAQVTQIAVSRSKAAGSLHLLMANNPVFLIVRE